jgi:hypothetical protein
VDDRDRTGRGVHERVADRTEHQPGDLAPAPRSHDHELRRGGPGQQLPRGAVARDDTHDGQVGVLLRPGVELRVQERPRGSLERLFVEQRRCGRCDQRERPRVHGHQRNGPGAGRLDGELGAPRLGPEHHRGRTDEQPVVHRGAGRLPLGEPRCRAERDLRPLQEDFAVPLTQIGMSRLRPGAPGKGVHDT